MDHVQKNILLGLSVLGMNKAAGSRYVLIKAFPPQFEGNSNRPPEHTRDLFMRKSFHIVYFGVSLGYVLGVWNRSFLEQSWRPGDVMFRLKFRPSNLYFLGILREVRWVL